jgi:hypothetical protein
MVYLIQNSENKLERLSVASMLNLVQYLQTKATWST